jgi:flagella basal body P-ring formation protein FlgA
MKLRTLVMLCWLARFAPAQQPVCKPVEGDQIQGKDLAAALPAFRAIPPEFVLANSPAPGSIRTFHTPELLSLARQYSIQLETSAEVCFAWAMQPFKREALLEAMSNSLQVAGARIDIVEMTTSLKPPGRIEFARDRLGTPSSTDSRTPVLWRGDVIYGNDHRYPIWARVRITVHCDKLLAAEALKPGRAIEASQIRTESGECFPTLKGTVLTVSHVVGLLPTRPIMAGAELRPEWLKPPDDITRGDLIQVEVQSGSARLTFTGKAESGGRSGDMIAVRNPDSNRIFQARVSGKDKAFVLAGLSKEN